MEGHVGGNGSVVWQNVHSNPNGQFKFKTGSGKLGPKELRRGGAGEIEGRDDGVTVADIGQSPVPDIDLYPALRGFLPKPGYFFVRLRFDGAEAEAVTKWFESSKPVPDSFRIYTEGTSLILAVHVKAIERQWPTNDVTWLDQPWEIRYHW